MTEKSFFISKRNVAITAIIYTFLWGTAFPLVKVCMESLGISDYDNMSKCLVAGIRFTLSGFFTLLWCMFFYEKNTKILKNELKYGVIYGILGTAVQYAFTYIGLSRIDGSKGAIFDQLCVFFIVLSSGLFFKTDSLNLKKILGCVLGFLGVSVINIEGLSFEFTFGGEGIMICAAICQSFAYFVAKGCADKMSAAKLVGLGQLLGGLMLTLFSILYGGKILTISVLGIITLLALVFISSVAYVLSLMPLKYFEASEISSFNLLITVFGVIMSALILGENIFKWNYLLAVILVSAGIITLNSRRKK